MLRGGAFNNDADNARCAYRNRNHPHNRNNNIGFRVVVSTFFKSGARKCLAGFTPARTRERRMAGLRPGRCGMRTTHVRRANRAHSAPRPGGDSRRGAMSVTYEAIHTWENLHAAWRQAARGKRGSATVAAFDHRAERELVRLQEELCTKTYQPGRYISFFIHEPKRRLISAAPFRDRVLHHALCNVINPVLESGFIAESYANQVGKGTHRALDAAQYLCARYHWVLPCDVRQFFPALDHSLLKELLFRKIKDGSIQSLISAILRGGEGILAGEYEQDYFPGDDLLAALRPRGLPIGNLTSQFWANCFLTPFDHFVKRELRCAGYVRYVDDFLLFGNNKDELHEWHQRIVQRMERHRLRIHSGAHPRPVTEGVPFLGFMLFPTHRRLKSRKGWHFTRRYRALLAQASAGHIPWSQLSAVVLGWVNHVKNGDTVGLRRKVLRG